MMTGFSPRRRFLVALGMLFFNTTVWARPFKSAFPLKVYVRGTSDTPDRFVGFTPTSKGRALDVPQGQLWYVRPKGSLSAIQLDRLVKEMQREEVPGIDLSDHWELSNESMSHLKPLGKLSFLDISRTKVSDRGLTSLSACKSLTVLLLPNGITDKGVEHLLSFRELRELNLDQTQVSDTGLALLSQLPHLENVDLTSTGVTDAAGPALAQMVALRRLVLNGRMTQASVFALKPLKHLQEVDARQMAIGDEGLAVLGKLPALKTLYLGSDVTDAGLKELSKSRSLQALDLSQTKITDVGIEYLSKIGSLQDVALSNTSIGDDSMRFVSKLKHLRMLELSDTKVTVQGLSPLTRLKELEILSFSWKTLSREDVQRMSEFKQLKMIILNGTPLPEATMAQLRRMGTPSPWEPIAGLERARQRHTAVVDPVALGAPVGIPADVSGRRKVGASMASAVLSTHRKKADLHAASGLLMDRRSGPSFFSPDQTAMPLTLKKPIAFTKKEEKLASLPTQPEAIPSPAVTTPAAEDNLLREIQMQSSPEKAGGFSGFSGMRQLRQSATLASLDDVSGDASRPAVPVQEDKPENSVGEFSVRAIRSR